MTTSLAEQLKRLAIPQTKVLNDSRKRVSLLFEPKEAANLAKESVYQIGSDGLEELISIDKYFKVFQASPLFNDESKQMQRAVESKEVNSNLDELIKKFLIRLSPYMLLKSSHKALEWLIYRHQIHELNVKELFSAALPYHESNIFVRVLQLFDLSAGYLKNWNWLLAIQTAGLHLPKQVLINHCKSDSSFLRLVFESTEAAIEEFQSGKNQSKLRTQLAFFTSTLSGLLSQGHIDDHILTIILPSILKGLTSPIDDFRAASFIAVGQLVSNNQLESALTQKLLQTILQDELKTDQMQRIYLLLIIFQRQEPKPQLPNVPLESFDCAVPVLAELAKDGFLVGPLVLAIVESCLKHLEEEDAQAQVLCWSLAEQVHCNDETAASFFRLLTDRYESFKGPQKGKKMKIAEELSDKLKSLTDWLKVLIEMFYSKYADAFGKIKNPAFQNLRRQWSGEEPEDVLDPEMAALVRRCCGTGHATAWQHLKPLLLKQIDGNRIFKAWCKASPADEPLTLLLILERILRPSPNNLNARLLISKVSEYTFGQHNQFIIQLKALFEGNNELSVQEAIEQVLTSTWNQDKEARWPVTQWMKAIKELRLSGQLSTVSNVWSVALRMLIASIPKEADADLVMDIIKVLDFVPTLPSKQQLPVVSDLLERTKNEIWQGGNWVDLSKVSMAVHLRVKVLELALCGLHESTRCKTQFAEIVKRIFKECFPTEVDSFRFLIAICGGVPYSSSAGYIPSPLLQIHALHCLWTFVSGSWRGKYWIKLETTQTTCHLLLALSHGSKAVRQAVVHCLSLFVGEKHFGALISHLLKRKQEIIADSDHVSVALYCLLSPDASVQESLPIKDTKRLNNDREKLFQALISPEIPLYVAAKVSTLTETITSREILQTLSTMARRALDLKTDQMAANEMIQSYWQRITVSTVSALDDPTVWELARDALASKSTDHLCPAVTFLKSITKEVFAALPSERQTALLELMVITRAEAENPAISGSVAAVCKKITLDGPVVQGLLKKMVDNLPKELNVTPSTVLESKTWRHGIALLELIQNKKKLRDSRVLVEPLFAVLKFCLDQEEQTTYEYAKQLVLGCILEICERHLAGFEKLETISLDVELIIQCLRASANPQTHHHALLLLSCLGSIIPVQVMHNMMAVFTFMGSSIARLDDEHSVQVVAKVVDTIVPVLVQSLNEGSSDDAVVAEVVRIFVWTLRHVPQHRRVPLYTRLLSTLDPDRSLWIFLLLLFENYVVSAYRVDKTSEGNMPNSLQLGMELALSFGPQVVLRTTLKLIHYLIQIPIHRMSPNQEDTPMDEDSPKDGLFDIQKHTPKQLRHYTYTLFTFLNSMLADPNLMIQVRELELEASTDLEQIFKDCIAALLLYAPLCASQQQSTQLAKFWKTMVTLNYDVLDRLVALITSDTLVGVITNLLEHSSPALRRKAVDLVNVHIQSHKGGFNEDEKTSLSRLLNPLLDVATNNSNSQEEDLIQQTALLSLRLLAKVLAPDDPMPFKQVLEKVSKLLKSSGHLLASAVLTVADLVAHLKVRAVSELPNFLPAILKAFAGYVRSESADIVLMSLSAGLYRIVEALAPFLSPYMDKLLHSISCLAVQWPEAGDLNRKLQQLRQKLSTNVAHRVLMPSLGRTYAQLVAEERYSAVGPLLSILGDSLATVPDVSKLLPDLTPFLLQVLQIRSDSADNNAAVKDEDIMTIEGAAIDALLHLVLKLSELSFKPLYYQIFHWASEHPHRAITFYRLSSKLAEGLKGLFVLFAGHFLQNAANLLDATNVTKTEKPYFGTGPDADAKAILLLESILQTLHTVFLFDSTTFLSKDKFQALLLPLVDQLDNTLGGAEALAERSERLLTPCLAQMTLATDDTQWKALNYQLLNKTRSSSPLVRIAALRTVVEVAAKLGEDYLPLLPETIGSLAELLEDEDERVEEAMKNALRRMEDDLGQPIREYFN